jgi:fibronectin type 3 domain-containing protein
MAAANTVADGTARIVWTKTSGAKKYYVCRASSQKGKFKRIAETKACSYRDDTAKAGKKYYYKVAAVDKKGKKKWSGKVCTKTKLDRPHTSLKYPKGKNGRLVWKAVPEAHHYVVYRKADGGSWRKIKSTKKTYYSSSRIKRGSRYWYKVKAVKKNGKGASSKYSPWITTMNYAWVP